MYRAKDFETAVDMADKLVMFAGAGHTSVLYTNQVRLDWGGAALGCPSV
jgi:acetaldehyde dehydrogenase/alcohol dehydrogenase